MDAVNVPERITQLTMRANLLRDQLEAAADELVALHEEHIVDFDSCDEDDIRRVINDGVPYAEASASIMQRKIRRLID